MFAAAPKKDNTDDSVSKTTEKKTPAKRGRPKKVVDAPPAETQEKSTIKAESVEKVSEE